MHFELSSRFNQNFIHTFTFLLYQLLYNFYLYFISVRCELTDNQLTASISDKPNKTDGNAPRYELSVTSTLFSGTFVVEFVSSTVEVVVVVVVVDGFKVEVVDKGLNSRLQVSLVQQFRGSDGGQTLGVSLLTCVHGWRMSKPSSTAPSSVSRRFRPVIVAAQLTISA